MLDRRTELANGADERMTGRAVLPNQKLRRYECIGSTTTGFADAWLRIDGEGLPAGIVGRAGPRGGLRCCKAGLATALSNNALKLTAPRGRHCRLTEWNQWQPRAHSRTGAAA